MEKRGMGRWPLAQAEAYATSDNVRAGRGSRTGWRSYDEPAGIDFAGFWFACCEAISGTLCGVHLEARAPGVIYELEPGRAELNV
jgi:hypothetical protein